MLADVARIWARGRLGDAHSGAIELRRSLAEYLSQGNRLCVPTFRLSSRTSKLGRARPSVRWRAIDEGLATAQDGGQNYTDAFLYRLRGDLLLKLNPNDPEPAAAAYKTAVEVSEHQGMRTYRLLASLSLAKLYLSTARPVEAHAVLAPALEGFTDAGNARDRRGAGAAGGARGDRRGQGEASAAAATDAVADAYGNALLPVRGYGAPETTEAFARARESASGDKDATERLAADYGVWGGSYVRGDLPSMREHAAAFLRDVEVRPDSPEASVAQRAAGNTCWFVGEYREARDHFERALALFQPGRDEDLAFRFGWDPGVAAMANLATALWALGEVDRAIRSSIACRRGSPDLTHVGTLAPGRMHAGMFELMRRDYGARRRTPSNLPTRAGA